MKRKLGQDRSEQDFYRGMIRLHILHHASKKAVFGFWFIEELARHGYRLSPGTLYPQLHEMERRGYLCSAKKEWQGRIRRVYRATKTGRTVLQAAKERVRELFGELFEDE
ncbi:MAG: PadR family transcriptional regulator [Deltaproteobacteria bacterium RBG_16_55_12]|nr:MAG: PadR family transcriptional regulator [Deltaproteobacteria bacterium RBG_16_55_12]